MTLRSNHEIMIEQGDNWAIVRLRDKDEAPGKSANGMWTKTAVKTSDDEPNEFSSSANEYIKWDWTANSPGVLRLGAESDQSKSSHKDGEGKWLQVLITLNGVRRSSDGRFSAASEGKGRLTYQSRLFKAGDIKWTVVRYEQ
jgi:hypothetical protein